MAHKDTIDKAEVTPTRDAPVEKAPLAVADVQSARLPKLKTAFLYVLIGALVVSAIIAVLALLIGQFNAAIGRSFLTIFILFSHSLFILALLWADSRNDVGRKLLPTSILALAFANMITTTLATWDIISVDTAWRSFWLYFLLLGAVFIIVGTLKLRVNQTATQVALYTSTGLIALTVLTLIPWVLDLFAELDPVYYRVLAALSILATTAYMVAIIIRGIATSNDPSLKLVNQDGDKVSGGMLAIYITLGTVASFVWFIGFVALLVTGVQSSSPTPSTDRDYRNSRSIYN